MSKVALLKIIAKLLMRCRAGLWLCGALGQSILRGPITPTARNPSSINPPKIDCVRVILFYARDSKLASYKRMFTSHKHRRPIFYNLCISISTNFLFFFSA